MNTTSIDCHKVNSRPEVKKPGDFFIYEADLDRVYIYLIVPGEIETMGFRSLPIYRGPVTDHPGWHWDGNLDKPTLTPSIFAKGLQGEDIWHGFMTAGRLVSC